MDTARVGRRIKAFRKLKGYTQAEFARVLDIPLSVLGGMERGTREPSNELIQKIAETLTIDVKEIIPKDE
ncbi:DNA-binding transcriptional regulator, XRE-family HTH domain [Oceanobacillus limi]|uniref:DNA-binding transcriptional regulator, XRE-family HTH domain n=1 Tax=Oceanobacillus limi TaxID=930131 RepID=A0A1I0HJG9_9BACI|nr:helix-turn-helix transcriptional regulator [Oceanobacillus limi]SET84110.1 DNA-binding transcriptional regulator, XRE-family HTH domain [Oceanobacillus limi]